jgi:hypothetical protein
MSKELIILLLLISMPLIGLPVLGFFIFGGSLWISGYLLFESFALKIFTYGNDLNQLILIIAYLIISLVIFFLYHYFSTDYPITKDLRNSEYIKEAQRLNEIHEVSNDHYLKFKQKELRNGDLELHHIVEIPEKISNSKQVLNRIHFVFEAIVEKFNNFLVNFRHYYFKGTPPHFNGTYFSEIDIQKAFVLYKEPSENLWGRSAVSLFFGGGPIYSLAEYNYISFQETLTLTASLLLYVFCQFYILRTYTEKNPSLNKVLGWINRCETRQQRIGYKIYEIYGVEHIEIKFFDSQVKLSDFGFIYEYNNENYIVIPSAISKKTLKKIFNKTLEKRDFDRWVKVLKPT